MSDSIPLTLEQKDKMLTEIYHSVAGHPLDPTKPGLVAIVDRHDKAIYGEQGDNGLKGTQKKIIRFLWMAAGFGIAVNVGLAIWAVLK